MTTNEQEIAFQREQIAELEKQPQSAWRDKAIADIEELIQDIQDDPNWSAGVDESSRQASEDIAAGRVTTLSTEQDYLAFRRSLGLDG